MSYAAHRRDFGPFLGQGPGKTKESAKWTGIFRRILGVFIKSWQRRAARHRLARSIAHLDHRLLADIGLGAEDLGFAEQLARKRGTDYGTWAGRKSGPGTHWE